jgi:hypothetical protein
VFDWLFGFFKKPEPDELTDLFDAATIAYGAGNKRLAYKHMERADALIEARRKANRTLPPGV